MKLSVISMGLLVASIANASSDIWEGAGAHFDLQGQQTGTYNLQVENTKVAGQIQSLVTVTLPDGTIQTHRCEITPGASGWASNCDHGKGGGRCYGEGLCLTYEEDASGSAFATTIAFDGTDDMRLLRTQLKNGKAVRIFREKLHKK